MESRSERVIPLGQSAPQLASASIEFWVDSISRPVSKVARQGGLLNLDFMESASPTVTPKSPKLRERLTFLIVTGIAALPPREMRCACPEGFLSEESGASNFFDNHRVRFPYVQRRNARNVQEC
jgi:hypothetical protein